MLASFSVDSGLQFPSSHSSNHYCASLGPVGATVCLLLHFKHLLNARIDLFTYVFVFWRKVVHNIFTESVIASIWGSDVNLKVPFPLRAKHCFP